MHTLALFKIVQLKVKDLLLIPDQMMMNDKISTDRFCVFIHEILLQQRQFNKNTKRIHGVCVQFKQNKTLITLTRNVADAFFFPLKLPFYVSLFISCNKSPVTRRFAGATRSTFFMTT